jgi:hypothetical protein
VTKSHRPPTTVRANVYVDGINLYYGCVKGTSFKWLDIAEVCRRLLPAHFQIHRIRYFTALVKPRPGDPQQQVRQQTFIRALQTLPNLSVHYGEFLQSNVRMQLTRLRNSLAHPSAQRDTWGVGSPFRALLAWHALGYDTCVTGIRADDIVHQRRICAPRWRACACKARRLSRDDAPLLFRTAAMKGAPVHVLGN